MANLKEVRTRIASVSSTQQITSAMKMVSAAKFRRAQNAIIGMRPYVSQMAEIVEDIDVGDGIQTPYHQQRPVGMVLLVVVTSNKGLCGAFNSNVLKMATQRIDHYAAAGANVRLVTIGKKATELLSRRKEIPQTSHDELLDNPSFDAAAEIVEQMMSDFVEKRIDKVEVIYNQFKNSLSQILSTEQLLPVEPRAAEASAKVRNDYIYEPSKEGILREMTPLMIRSNFYRIILDSLAAEHGARMTSMQKATDNATSLLKDLRLSYNKARQAAITNEIIEIVSGSEALKG